jgi:RNA polymerase sigma factor (sigma-70 family)
LAERIEGDQHDPHQTAPDGVAGGLSLPIEAELEARDAVAGDVAALQDLWARHRRWVAAILLAHKPKWADVDDLLQEVAVSMVRKVGELRDPRAVKPWLRTVAINAAHAAGRSGVKRSRDVSLDDERPVMGREGPADSTELDDGRRLMDLSRHLPDGYREPLLLKAVQGLTYREIGQILGLPETTIETRIARGRRMLRELAAGHGVGGMAEVR